MNQNSLCKQFQNWEGEAPAEPKNAAGQQEHRPPKSMLET